MYIFVYISRIEDICYIMGDCWFKPA